MIMVSFDIFDTLITRKTALPMGIFLQIREKEKLPSDFAEMRISAEKDARLYALQSNKEEITLKSIYDLLSRRLGQNMDSAMDAEVETEMENVYPLWNRINLLKDFLAKGEHVVLISDMYLEEHIIRKMLLKVDPVFKKIPIYVSCNYGKTKQSGALFLEVAKLEKIEFNDWMHYGDNHYSDFLVPRMLGINAIQVENPQMTTWEKQLSERLDIENNLLLQYCIGAAKIVREEHSLNSVQKIGSSLGSIILYPYVLWLLKSSINLKISRLYFMARDGYILKRIADKIIQNQHLDIETKYIYSSRNAWRLGKDEIEKRNILVQYLNQEIEFKDDNFALVDLHGTGLTIEYLVDILNDYAINRKIKVFYYDLLGNRISENFELYSFCSDHTGLVELFCRAPHGATIGYELDNGQVKPVTKETPKALWEKTGLFDYFEGVELFSDVMSEQIWKTEENSGRKLSEAALECCRTPANQDVLQFLGDFPHCGGIDEENIAFAPKLKARDIFNLYMWRTVEKNDDFYKGSDLSMSLMRTDKKNVKLKLFFDRHYDRSLGTIIHSAKVRRMLPKRKKVEVILYAAGRNGRALYQHLLAHSGFKIVGWTDIEHEKYALGGYPVISCDEALKQSFDYIIISIGDVHKSDNVKNILMSRGVDADKIIPYEMFVEQFLK